MRPRCPSLAERIPKHDVARVLALDQHVGAADGIGLGVDLLAEQGDGGVRIQGGDVLLGGGEHAAGPAGRVEDVDDLAGLVERVLVRGEQQVDHQLDHLAGREVLARGLVGDF